MESNEIENYSTLPKILTLYLKLHEIGQLNNSVKIYNDIKAAIIASKLNECGQAMFKNTIFVGGMPLFNFTK